jgi:hypothetical protein
MSKITEQEIEKLSTKFHVHFGYTYDQLEKKIKPKEIVEWFIKNTTALESDPATPESTDNWQKIGDKDEWLDEVRGREESAVEKDWLAIYSKLRETKNLTDSINELVKMVLINERKDNVGVWVKVEFKEMDRMVLTRKSGDTFTVMNTRRNENLIDFFSGREKTESQIQNSNVGVSDAIPYQLCPKCNGQGTVSKPPYITGDVHQWSSTSSQFQCDVCQGAKIIPMIKSQPQQKEV